MTIVRALAMVAVVVFCAAFIPVGGCAKGCGGAGRVAAHQGDDIARIGTRGSLGLSGTAYADDLARGGGRYTDDLARTGGGHADDMVHVADDVHVTGLADDLEQSSLKLTETQHSEVKDALKTVGEELAGQLAEGDDEEDEQDIKRAATDLDKRLKQTLTREQLRAFRAEFGTSKQVVERLAREQTLKPASAATKP